MKNTYLFFLIIVLGISVPILAGPLPKEEIIAELPKKNYGEALQLHQLFESASQKYRVPVVILEALGWSYSRWNNGDGKPSSDWGYGFMGLISKETFQPLDKGAWLTETDPWIVKNKTDASINAAAAFLRGVEDHLGLSVDSLESWAPALDAYFMWQGRNETQLRSQQIRGYYATINEREMRGFSDGSLFVMDPAEVSPDKAVEIATAYFDKVDEKPKPPTGFKVKVKGTKVFLSWDADPSPDKVLYNIYWEGGGDQQYHPVGDMDVLEKNKRVNPQLIDENLIILKHVDPSKDYAFYLEAVGFNGKVSRTQALKVTLR